MKQGFDSRMAPPQSPSADIMGVDALLDNDAWLPEVWDAVSTRMARSPLVQDMVRGAHGLVDRLTGTTWRDLS